MKFAVTAGRSAEKSLQRSLPRVVSMTAVGPVGSGALACVAFDLAGLVFATSLKDEVAAKRTIAVRQTDEARMEKVYHPRTVIPYQPMPRPE
jgi:hypothetical protein